MKLFALALTPSDGTQGKKSHFRRLNIGGLTYNYRERAIKAEVRQVVRSLARKVRNLANVVSGTIGARNEITRVQWLARTLGNIPPGGRLLDAGCGEQQFRRFCSHLEYVGQDFAQYDGKGDGTGRQTGAWGKGVVLDLICDITSIPEPDTSFDAIMCTEVLEHVPDPVKALGELARLLRPGGSLILTAPFCSLSHFAPFHFSTGFNRYWYEFHLKSLGFTVMEIVPNGHFYDFLAQELRRLPEVTRQYCPMPFYALSLLTHLIFVAPLLRILNTAAKYQRGSSELLCFGYHVVARRNP